MNIFRSSLLVLFSLLIFFAKPLLAQDEAPRYLPNVLIIKYEDDQALSDLRLKNRSAPKDNIQSFLRTFGASQPRPLMPSSSRTAVRRKMQNRDYDISRNQFEQAASEVERIYTVRYVADVDAAWLAAKVSRLPGVEYAEPKYLRYTQYEPSDTTANSYENYHNFMQAWDVTRGSKDVKIAIVDSGVDYNHTELDDKLWVNQDEVPTVLRPQVDQDADGTITSTEIYQYLQDQGTDYNGDGSITLQDALADSSPFMNGNVNDRTDNGFRDDLFGWDFWASGYNDQNITEDNDPIMDANDHGTHVGGIAAAESDNGEGIAAAGFNSGYMAIKAGGVEDEPATPDIDESRAIGFGPEGILYAANNGADVINCSWGGPGFSQAEKDIISYATRLGAVVVGASGNSGSPEVIYPAAHTDAIAVGSIETNNTVASYSNVGLALDVLATGSNIQSTIGSNQIGSSTGTSMSAPVVSGLAALLRNLHPGWSAKRISKQIRASAIPLGNNLLLGHGKVDANRAVTTNLPGLEIEAVSFVNENGDKLGFAESGNMLVTLVNYGAPTSGLELTASSLAGSGIELPSPTTQIGAVGTNDTVQVAIPLRITLDFDLSNTPTFSLVFSDAPSQYADFGVFRYDDLLYDVMAANRVKMSVSADGTIGFTDPLTQQGGVGFIPRQKVQGGYEDGENLLFEGGLMLEMDGTLHDAVRGVDGELSRDFNPRSTFRLQQSGAADLQGNTTFNTDTVNHRSADINVTSYAYEDPQLSNVVFMLYEIRNPYSFFEFNNVYAGLFNDWDLGNSSNNSTAFSPQDSILYVYDEDDQSTQPVVAVATVGPLSSAFAINNAAEGSGYDFGLYDGFTDSEKRRSLKAGTQKTNVSGTDVSAVVASGPYNVGPRATVRVGFVYAFGDNVDKLRSQIQQARSRAPFEVSNKGLVVSDEEPDETEFFQNYPNPFNRNTRLRLDLSQESHVQISIYNTIGQKVTTLVDSRLEPRIHIFDFYTGSLSSGVYFARLTTENRTKTIKMVLVK